MENSNFRSDQIKRRGDYNPSGPQEAFIVPLLKEAIETRLEKLSSRLSDSQDKKLRVLDVGCGRQPFRDFFPISLFDYRSFDVQNHDGQPLDFVGPIDGELPDDLASEEPFDFILCTEVLEHVADWNKAFQNFAQLLAPGGELLLTAPFFYPLHEQPYDYWRPTPFAIKFFAKKHGLEVFENESLGSSLDIVGTLLARQELVALDHFIFLGSSVGKIGPRWSAASPQTPSKPSLAESRGGSGTSLHQQSCHTSQEGRSSLTHHPGKLSAQQTPALP